MSEGSTYQCGWEQSAEGWLLWLRSRPRLEGRGASLEEAELNLTLAVCAAIGDGEPIFTFVPPLPITDADRHYLARGLALLDNRAYGWIRGQPADYLRGEPCGICRYLPGPRNDAPLVESSPPEGDLCHRNQPRFGPVLATERFIALLTQAERDCLEIRPVIRPPRSRTHVYELIPRLIVPHVAVLGGTVDGWRCAACSTAHFDCTVRGGEVHRFIADEALGSAPPPLFGVGSAVELTLAMPMDRAMAISAHPHARGAAAIELGTAATPEIDPAPSLRAFDPRWS